MKIITFLCIQFFLISNLVVAQVPSWKVDENTYQYSMTFLAKLNANGKQLVSANDKVAAFFGNTCRGVSGLTYVASKNNYYAYLTVFSNTQGEVIKFKLYDSTNDKVIEVSKQISFNVNEHKGNLFQSYSIAEPTLNNKAEVLTFDFMNIKTVSSSINNGKISINIYDINDLTLLKPIFNVSKGAKLLKNRVLQKSGENTVNFTSEILYEVLSEDESSLNNYIVFVQKVPTPTLFYKKDAVCYARGAIKVVSNKEGKTVTINKNGKVIFTKKIINGEATFTDLEVDSYIVSIDSEVKLINIDLKTK
ncbi:hypothetical protein [Polaribacter gangjinensis]|uniref:Uncharacterized protein n=1 Tax=Polaribacter gangjinensis TaxID=574710 RepID=A0A2S7WC85_9FLAO|nr:hypothetical protein [Polaribacter gangjinensis]PQJ75197.1 hypothetical protein BTO13_08035 [Polaribacter gangjinensis]